MPRHKHVAFELPPLSRAGDQFQDLVARRAVAILRGRIMKREAVEDELFRLWGPEARSIAGGALLHAQHIGTAAWTFHILDPKEKLQMVWYATADGEPRNTASEIAEWKANHPWPEPAQVVAPAPRRRRSKEQPCP